MIKRQLVSAAVSAAMLASSFAGMNIISVNAAEANTPKYRNYKRMMEKIDRGLFAVKTTADTRGQSVNGVYLSWRLLGSESLTDQAFDIYRSTSENGTYTKIKTTGAHDATCWTDTSGSESNWYKVVPAGSSQDVIDAEKAVKPTGTHAYAKPSEVGNGNSLKNSFAYVDIPIERPADSNGGHYYNTSTNEGGANDAAVGDLDDDGEYEIVLKWDPTNSKDAAGGGTTGHCYIDGYEIDPTNNDPSANANGHLYKWRLDLGPHVRSGAHETPFLVYDFDGDGRSEIAALSGPGAIDGQGRYVTEAGDTDTIKNADNNLVQLRKGKNIGPEYYTIFDGETGEALCTTDAIPLGREDGGDWGDAKMNRSSRYLAAVAYIDGVHPSIIMCRGYYNRAVVRSYIWDGSSLELQWEYDSGQSGVKDDSLYGQGNHNLSISDIDDDGKDEIIYGSACLDDDGVTILGNTKLGHGDAMHVSDFNNDGKQEVQSVKEDSPYFKRYAEDVRNALTGNHFWSSGKLVTSDDNGRGCMDNIDDAYALAQHNAGNDSALALSWSSGLANIHDLNGDDLKAKPSSAGSGDFCNFLVYWDGDLSRELLDANIIQKYDAANGWTKRFYGPSDGYTLVGGSTNNYTKRNPSLVADLWGDWREEIIMPTGKGQNDSPALRIFTSTISTDYRLTTLMHDCQYRLAVAWQNTGYNQPPHQSYYIGSVALATDESGNTMNYLAPKTPYTTVTYELEHIPVTGVTLSESLVRVEKTKTINVKANVQPENALIKKVFWTSSDESIATVTNGIIKGVGEGTATITAKTKEGEYTAQCTVEVYQTHVTGISLSADNIDVGTGYTKQLNAAVTPDNATVKTVNWTTSDSSIATVDSSGVVTGVNAGVATITASTEDGNYTAVCTVNVKPMMIVNAVGSDSFVTPTTGTGIKYSNVSANSVTINQTAAATGAEAYKIIEPADGGHAHLSFRLVTGGTKDASGAWDWTGRRYTLGLQLLGKDDSNILSFEQPYGLSGNGAGTLTSKAGDNDVLNFSSDWTTVVDGLGNIQGSTKRWIVDIEFDYDNDNATATVTGTDSSWAAVSGQYTKEFDLNGLNLEKIRLYTTDGGDNAITATPQLSNLVYEKITTREGTPATLYQRGVSADNAWSENDLTDWTATGNLKLDTENDRIYYTEKKPGGSYEASKQFDIPASASQVTYNFDWYFGGATSRLSNKEYLQIGNIRLGWSNAKAEEGSGYFVLASKNGGTTYEGVIETDNGDGTVTYSTDDSKKLFIGANAVYTKNVRMTIDTATQTITSLVFDGKEITDFKDYALGEVPSKVSFGFQRAGSTDNWDYPVGLDSITVSTFTDDNPSTATPKPTDAPTPTPTATPIPTATPKPALVSNDFNAAASRLIYINTTDTAPYTALDGVTLYIGTRSDGLRAETNLSIEAGGVTGNALVMNSERYADASRGPRVKINTPELNDNTVYTATISVKPVNGAGGEAKLYYGDSTSSQATNKIAAEADKWSTFKTVITKKDGAYTREFFLNDVYIGKDTTGTFPVLWGTEVAGTGAKVYLDDLAIIDEPIQEAGLVISDPVTADGKVSVTVTNNTAADQPIQLIIAAYDENGVLTGIKLSEAVTAEAGKEITVSADAVTGASTKIMLWDSISAMQSLMTAK